MIPALGPKPLRTSERGPEEPKLSEQSFIKQIWSKLGSYRPPWVRRMGFPVRVIAMSDKGCRRIALKATVREDRIAVCTDAISGWP